ncbi:unnamed protein product [Periconia digitata]|uniref:Xylanolytic transcriptional activator regulatory domain-containing protein n=1 Tax=Periconia digitata TaxID=1303443 RepID=A0A9W4XMR1_9PLEO|nr:unnamed protein product [Periconia digitata]
MQSEHTLHNAQTISPRPDDESSSQTSLTKRRIRRVTAACELCRQRRVKVRRKRIQMLIDKTADDQCDATRPTCTACSISSQQCIYRTTPHETSVGALKRKFGELETHYDRLKGSKELLEQLLHAIRTRPDDDATVIFESIRSGCEVESIIRHFDHGVLSTQSRVIPETSSRLDLLLKSGMPNFFQSPDNCYLQSTLHKTVSAPPASAQYVSTIGGQHSTPYMKPYFTASLVDSRFDRVVPSRWTQVSDDDILMRALLRLYFLHEHQWLGCFHIDDFLDDMLSGSNEHCTPLLVNTIMALACHSHQDSRNRADHRNPKNLGYRFFAEAKRLWELHSTSKKSLPSLQTALLLNLLFNLHSSDRIGRSYQDQAISIAHEIDLFNLATHTMSASGRDSRGFTLWCLYWWVSLQDYHYRVYTVRESPSVPCLPNPDNDPRWYGELWLQYSQDVQYHPVGYGHLFKAKCELSNIVNSVVAQLHSNEPNELEKRVAIAKAHIDALRSWHAALPNPLSSSHLVFPSHLKLHMLYQDVMIRLCEIVLTVPPPQLQLRPDHPIQQLSTDSKLSFVTLMRLYYLRHGFGGCDVGLIHNLHVLAYIAQERLKALTHNPNLHHRNETDEARGILFLAAKGFDLQSENYHLAFTLLCKLRENMSQEEVNNIYEFAGISRIKSAMRRLRTENV